MLVRSCPAIAKTSHRCLLFSTESSQFFIKPIPQNHGPPFAGLSSRSGQRPCVFGSQDGVNDTVYLRLALRSCIERESGTRTFECKGVTGCVRELASGLRAPSGSVYPASRPPGSRHHLRPYFRKVPRFSTICLWGKHQSFQPRRACVSVENIAGLVCPKRVNPY